MEKIIIVTTVLFIAVSLQPSTTSAEGYLGTPSTDLAERRSDNPQTCEDYCMRGYRTCVGGCNNPDWSDKKILQCNEGCMNGYDGCVSSCALPHEDDPDFPCC